MKTVLLAGALAIVPALIAAQSAQRPQATFRSEINYVEVDVVVTDAQGRFVPGLTADDFELLDAGKLQRIEAFHEINVPIEHADRVLYSPAAIYPDIASNATASEGRVYLLVIDDLHISAQNSIPARRRAREFVERYVGSNDLVAVIHTSGRSDVSQEFTSNRELVLKAIGGIHGGGLQSATLNKLDDAVRQAAAEITDRPIRDNDARERAVRAEGVLMTLRNLADYLGSFKGRRKSMLVFSEGFNLTGESANEILQTQDVRGALSATIAAATRANVSISTIDAEGLPPSGPGADVQGLASATAGVGTVDMQRERRNSQGTLRTLADQTGGQAIVNTNFFAEGLARIQRDSSTYYLLGFYPTTNRDGRFHKLEVRAKKPGLRITARAGYHAPKPGAAVTPPADDLGSLVRAAVPSAGLPMTMSLPVFRDAAEGAVAVVALDVPSSAFRFETAGDISSEDLEILYQVVDPGASVRASGSQRVEMRLKPDTRERIEQRGFRVLLPIKLKPGRYQVRLAAESKNGAKRGSVFADLEVPDFSKEPVVWSGVSLTSANAAAVPTRPVDNAAEIVPLVPAAVRMFRRDDTLALYAEAYVNDRRTPHTVDLVATVRDTSGRVVFSTTEERSTSELGDGPGGFGLRVDVPLKDFAAGQYVLTLTARSRSSSDAPVTRDIPFAIS